MDIFLLTIQFHAKIQTLICSEYGKKPLLLQQHCYFDEQMQQKVLFDMLQI